MYILSQLDEYIRYGGHDIQLLEYLYENTPENLRDNVVLVCAAADLYASKEVWIWLQESLSETRNVKRIAIGGGSLGDYREFHCRQALWNRIRLMALENVGAQALVAGTGPVMPEAEVLLIFCDVWGFGELAAQYYTCVHYGI